MLSFYSRAAVSGFPRNVNLGPVKLGRLFEETLRIEDHLVRLKG